MVRMRHSRLRMRRAAPGHLDIHGRVAAGVAQPPAKALQPLDPTLLIVSPAAAPVLALKYRLLPSFADLNPGDAAPIYLRIRHSTSDGLWNQIIENWKTWRNVPLDQFPVAEARKFVDEWRKQLQQLEFGAHRQTCTWNYTVPEQRLDIINVALEDAQSMRQLGLLMSIKARVEIAEGKLDDAIRTIETNLAFARHTAEGPFLINGLVGVGITTVTLDAVDELIARPDAPNLYWALTALPQPLIDMRHGLEIERKLCENLIPELRESELDRPRTPAEWATLLTRMHEGIVKWERFNMQQGKKGPGLLPELSGGRLSQFKSQALPASKEYLKRSRELTDHQLGAMSEDQIVALYIADGYREIWDDWFKASYLPAREAIAQQADAVKRLMAAKKSPFILFAQYVPAVFAVIRTELRIESPRRHSARDRGLADVCCGAQWRTARISEPDH